MVRDEWKKIQKQPVIMYMVSQKVIHVEPGKLTEPTGSSEIEGLPTLVSPDLNLVSCAGDEKGGSTDSQKSFLWEDY